MERSMQPYTAATSIYVAGAHDRLMPMDMSRWNPQDCLVAVIDGLADARNAARALREAGFVDDDVRLALAAEVIAIDDACSARGLLARIVAGIRTLGDEGIVAAAYVAEARCGHHMLIVYAPGAALRQRAHAMVARHRAHTVNYFGRWVIRGLQDR